MSKPAGGAAASDFERWFPSAARQLRLGGGPGPAAPAMLPSELPAPSASIVAPAAAGAAAAAGANAVAGSPAVAVLAFPPSGCAEDIFSSEGTGARRAPSPLLAWLAARRGVLLAAQAPGRAARSAEAPCGDAAGMAAAVLRALGGGIQGQRSGGENTGRGCTQQQHQHQPWRLFGSSGAVPYVVVSHSMGCWVAFELLLLARRQGRGRRALTAHQQLHYTLKCRYSTHLCMRGACGPERMSSAACCPQLSVGSALPAGSERLAMASSQLNWLAQ
eukprot:352884-Chlamydomonas_euryale.AAC.4